MGSIYALKGRFQALLRPLVGALFRAGITANQVTLVAAVISLLVAGLVYRAGVHWPLLYLLLPLWMLLRMALNAIDGMLAREFGQQSRLGAYLNELCDVVADAALYLSLLGVPGVAAAALWSFAWLAALTEYAGVLGLMVGASRRYDGPMGKSDRAFVVGVLGLGLASGLLGGRALTVVAIVLSLACVVTVWRRVRAGLAEAGVPA
ncbi:CDP-alcohol phosphatidyltransferase family protein [Xanthomonas maliensis]|uniref:CDP-alcohol phosphatidyltransferase family protein n=1 Tax=Xanthomonas maliensis TaxID=1321368 RepID=UPI0003A18802|nr:CDP-alcohol phosphatidyltransferase family protein [Xanthomonas maliensis]KAB7771042.1 CDP-alcohol phosphatidyltransferase [Xanthomonas maliensis]